MPCRHLSAALTLLVWNYLLQQRRHIHMSQMSLGYLEPLMSDELQIHNTNQHMVVIEPLMSPADKLQVVGAVCTFRYTAITTCINAYPCTAVLFRSSTSTSSCSVSRTGQSKQWCCQLGPVSSRRGRGPCGLCCWQCVLRGWQSGH